MVILMKRFFPLSTLPILLFVVLLIFSGCAHLGQQGMKAKVSLADIRILEIRALETAFKVELRVQNAHETPIHVQGIECDLKIDGNHFASGVSGAEHEIPPYESAIVPLTVYASVLDVVPSVITIIQGRTSEQKTTKPLQYELAGHIRLGSNTASPQNVPFESSGELSFDKVL